MLKCPNCGRGNADSSRTCSACGAGLLAGGPPAPGPRPRVALRVVRAEGGSEESAVMTEETLTCGQQGHLSLPDDPFLAGTQVRFFFEGPRLHAEDVGGENGTFVRLKTEAQLQAGHELRVGRQRLRLDPIPPPQPGPDGALAWGSSSGAAQFRLVQLMEGGVPAAAYLLGSGTYALGRDTGDIVFPQDGFISGRHASLTVRDQKVLVKDLGSSNGTFVPLVGKMAVDSGDQFLVGRELIRVEIAAFR